MNSPILCSDLDGLFPWPKIVSHHRVSSRFGGRKHPKTGQWQKQHGALDLATPTGNEVHAAASGEVVKIGWDYRTVKDKDGNITVKGYGRFVVLKHANGYFSLYAHLEKNGVQVALGDKVTDGDVIALSGNTGGSSGPHLHFEVRKGSDIERNYKNADKIDPEALVNGDLEMQIQVESVKHIINFKATDSYIPGVGYPNNLNELFIPKTPEPRKQSKKEKNEHKDETTRA